MFNFFKDREAIKTVSCRTCGCLVREENAEVVSVYFQKNLDSGDAGRAVFFYCKSHVPNERIRVYAYFRVATPYSPIGDVKSGLNQDKTKEKTKKCHRCEKEKPFSEFGKNNAREDGKQTWCRKCHHQYNHLRNRK